MDDEVEGARGRPKPDTVDIHVGARLRQRRLVRGMTQERLADAVGLTFQQIQKYERGINRVGASRLWDLARVLDVPIGFFYEEGVDPASGARPLAGGRAYAIDEQQAVFDDPPEAQELLRAFARITDPTVRQRVLDLVKSLAPPA